MFCFDNGDPAATRQGRCGRAFFQHFIEHCFWTTRHREPFGEDHDRSSGCVHVDRAHVGIADADRFTIGVAIRECTRGNTNACSNTDAGSFASSARGFTRGKPVVFEN